MIAKRLGPLALRWTSSTGPRKRFVAIGAALIIVSLAGCGRVGPLELPPGSTVDLAPNAKRALGPDGAPIVVPEQKKPLPIDWLLN